MGFGLEEMLRLAMSSSLPSCFETDWRFFETNIGWGEVLSSSPIVLQTKRSSEIGTPPNMLPSCCRSATKCVWSSAKMYSLPTISAKLRARI